MKQSAKRFSELTINLSDGNIYSEAIDEARVICQSKFEKLFDNLTRPDIETSKHINLDFLVKERPPLKLYYTCGYKASNRITCLIKAKLNAQ